MQYVITHVAHMRTTRGYQNCVLFNLNFVISVFVLSGISVYSLYGSHAGTKSECSLHPEIRTNCVCYNETTLYADYENVYLVFQSIEIKCFSHTHF